MAARAVHHGVSHGNGPCSRGRTSRTARLICAFAARLSFPIGQMEKLRCR
jgi:hypothetical protein